MSSKTQRIFSEQELSTMYLGLTLQIMELQKRRTAELKEGKRNSAEIVRRKIHKLIPGVEAFRMFFTGCGIDLAA